MFSHNQTSTKPSPTGLLLVPGLVIFIFCLGLVLTFCIVAAPAPSFKAAIAAYTNLTKSGVSNPVTAVILNFRSYDTLLELAVLFAVVVIVLPANRTYRIESAADIRFSQIATLNLVRKILPLTIVMSGYLLWTGASQPGGAFQAGALLAGCGLMALFSRAISIHFEHTLWRFALAAALAAFIFAGAVTHWLTGVFLLYPTDQAGLFIISIEFVATFSIGITLVLFYWVIATIDQVSQPSTYRPPNLTSGRCNMSQSFIYSACAISLFCIGLLGFMLLTDVIRKVLSINIMGIGIFMLLVATSAMAPGSIDPIPQAMVLTGIVVAAAGSALMLQLAIQIDQQLKVTKVEVKDAN